MRNINKKEFYSYIDSFGRKDGEYTLDEMFEIGLAHKALCREDKDWEWLVGIVGYPGNTEAYRSFVKGRQHRKTKDFVPGYEQFLNSGVNADATCSTDSTCEISSKSEKAMPNDGDEDNSRYSDLDRKMDEFNIKRIQSMDAANYRRRELRDEARTESFKEALLKSVKALPELKYEPYLHGVSNNNSEAVLLLSDLHIGCECSNMYNNYNVDIARKRLKKLSLDTIKYCKANKVSVLNICNLGDMVHGIIHTNARIETTMDITEQLMTASELLSEFLCDVYSAAPVVKYRSVLDNHSRAIANKNEAIEKENYCRIIDWYLKERLKSTRIVFCDDNLDLGIGKFTLNNGKIVMFAHGHQDSINTVFQNWVGLTREYIDFCLIGHYHCEKTKSFQDSRIIVNGSIVGTESYAFGRRLFSKPSQLLLVFDGETNDVMNISIGLENC